jgi:hypothetical protein
VRCRFSCFGLSTSVFRHLYFLIPCPSGQAGLFLISYFFHSSDFRLPTSSLSSLFSIPLAEANGKGYCFNCCALQFFLLRSSGFGLPASLLSHSLPVRSGGLIPYFLFFSFFRLPASDFLSFFLVLYSFG